MIQAQASKLCVPKMNTEFLAWRSTLVHVQAEQLAVDKT
jgi:hypothetical protein